MNAATPVKESKYVRVARLAYQMAQGSFPLYSHPKSPHRFTQPQLVACLLLMYYLKLSYRDMEEWLLATDKVCQVLELAQVPDYSTLAYANQRLLKIERLDELNQALLDRLEVKEEVVASDTTGYPLSQASTYYQSRTGRTLKEYWKGAYVVGTRSQFILGWLHGPGPGNDNVFLSGLRRKARRYVRKRHWVMLADAGFDGQAVKPGDLIPPIRRGGNLVDPDRKARADLVAAARLDGLFGQRWKTETIHSVIKRLFGEAIRARLRSLQRREPAIKGLVYNIHR
jgi:hypothetical protein